MSRKGSLGKASSLSPTRLKGVSLYVPEVAQPAQTNETIKRVPVADLHPNPHQPRSFMNEKALADLTASLSLHGLLQPVILREEAVGYTIVAGHRRVEAARRLGWVEIESVVRRVEDQELLQLAMVENFQREDLHAIDRLRALTRYAQLHPTQQEAARKIGMDSTTLSHWLRLNELGEAVLEACVTIPELSFGNLRRLLNLSPNHRLRAVQKLAAGEGQPQTEAIKPKSSNGSRSFFRFVYPIASSKQKLLIEIKPKGSAKSKEFTVEEIRSALQAALADLDTKK